MGRDGVRVAELVGTDVLGPNVQLGAFRVSAGQGPGLGVDGGDHGALGR